MPFLESGAIRFKQAYVYPENIESLFGDLGVPETPDLLSIDIDGNDYWVWQAITRFRPRMVVAEYNANYPPDVSWIMKYNAKHAWNGGTHYGASLLALEKLGASKGYALVGCDFTGVNAFFVLKEFADKFAGPHTAANHYEPPRSRIGTSQWSAPVLGEFVSE